MPFRSISVESQQLSVDVYAAVTVLAANFWPPGQSQ
jgi:hypothetical protein